jgi:hypothetical protein
VGIESDEAHKPRLRKFNRKCVFTLAEGDCIADAAVTIADSRGHVVEQVSNGPLLLARQPAGRCDTDL